MMGDMGVVMHHPDLPCRMEVLVPTAADSSELSSAPALPSEEGLHLP